MPLDRTDRQILNAVLNHGRATVREIAERTDHVAPTISRRLEDLAARGVIRGYVPIIAYEELGFELTVVFQFRVAGDGLASVTETLSGHDRIMDVYEVTGSYDVVAIGKFRDTDEMHDRVGALLTHPDVDAVDVSVVRSIVREHEPIPIDDDD